MSNNKIILLGVTGSIAAYKACDLIRQLVKNDCDVHVIMTRNAAKLVTPLTFKTLSKNPVSIDLFTETAEWRPEHISLAERGDLMVIAPATANIIAKIAYGIADDALSATALAFNGMKIIAPSMNTAMLGNPVTQENISILRQRNFMIIDPENGELACGKVGTGRLAPVEQIVNKIQNSLK
ncbi:MAG: phosphopantothenoylcysteine decarboxylase [Chlamydiae bacterium]|nr:MAG: phosphopantothenoylcysteine decarboxylase [Chlamydiota bacterium]